MSYIADCTAFYGFSTTGRSTSTAAPVPPPSLVSETTLSILKRYCCFVLSAAAFDHGFNRTALFLSRWKRTFHRVLAGTCGVLSIVILWSELVLSTSLHSPVGVMIGAYDWSVATEKSAWIQTVTFITLAYMSLCTYWSLFRMNLGWAYTLQGPQQSSPFSLLYNGEYFSRLQFALGYNFLMTLNAPK